MEVEHSVDGGKYLDEWVPMGGVFKHSILLAIFSKTLATRLDKHFYHVDKSPQDRNYLKKTLSILTPPLQLWLGIGGILLSEKFFLPKKQKSPPLVKVVGGFDPLTLKETPNCFGALIIHI